METSTGDLAPCSDPREELAPFVYDHLDAPEKQVRLVTIHTGGWLADACCALRTVSLNPLLVYKALSYVWGDPIEFRKIRINDKAFSVSENLWKALRRVRQENGDLIIWIDAICIDQKDNHEKSYQVALMKDIFAISEEALLFLRESHICDTWNSRTPPVSEGARCVFELLGVFSQDRHFHEFPCYVEDQVGALLVAENYRYHFMALAFLSECPRWVRIWTIQEALLPSKATLVWASERYAVDSFLAAIELYDAHYKALLLQPHLDFGTSRTLDQ